jgi:hypothetical protein
VSPAPRRALLVLAALALAVGACGGGGDEEAAPTTTEAPATTTTTEPPETTTTLSEEERALEALEGFTSQEQAQFRLFSNPPEIPESLPPLTGVVEPVTDLLVVRANPDGTPVVDDKGADVIVKVRVDGLGRPIAQPDGRILDDGGVEVPRDDQGPILLAVVLDDAGQPVYEDPPPPPPTPPSTEEGAEPPPRRVRIERRILPANRLLALGDSVLLGTQGTLPPLTGRWKTLLDAVESRLPGEGDDVLRGHGDIGRTVIVMLGHNVGPGEQYRVYLDAIQQALDERPIVDRVVWVSAAEIGAPQLAWNEALRAFVEERRAGGDTETHILDWALYNAAHPEYSDDGLHLTAEGRQVLSDLLAQFAGEAPDCDLVDAAGNCLA